jgi:dihydrofolate reductase
MKGTGSLAGPASTPELVLVAALGRANRVIGRGLDLPWHLPADLRHFKRLTMGETLLMGRRTFEALLHQFGAKAPGALPLPGRRFAVVSRRGHLPGAGHPDVALYPSIEAALDALAALPRVVVAGGGEIYAQTLPRADRLELTLVEGAPEGDVFFPSYEHLVGPVFEETHRAVHPAEDGRPAFAFVTYVRRVGA